MVGRSLLFGSIGVDRRPRLSMRRGLMPSLHNLLRQRWILLDRESDHVGSDLYFLAVEHVEQARNSFLETVLVPFLCRKIRISSVEDTPGTVRFSLGLRARFHLHRERNDQARTARPKHVRATRASSVLPRWTGLRSQSHS